MALSLVVGACEEQDFVGLERPLRVSASEGRLLDEQQPPLAHDTITRHSLDFRVSNSSALESETVVYARSLVNGVGRAAASVVLRIAAGASSSGRLPDLELEIGNALHLELQCCVASRCRPSAVLCPLEAVSDELCIAACGRIDDCLERCPASSACEQLCGDDANCLQFDCTADSGLQTCASLCAADEACLAGCEVAEFCTNDCKVSASSCLANCLAVRDRCVGASATRPIGLLPCALCNGEGLCELLRADDGKYQLRTASGVELSCEQSCVQYPSACLSECELLSAEGPERSSCLRSCVLAHQQRCSLDRTSISPTVEVPCCFSEQCEASMDAVLKLDSVECLQDSECGTTRQCNRRGLCENKLREEAASCSLTPGVASSGGASVLLLLGTALMFGLWTRGLRPHRRRLLRSLGPLAALLGVVLCSNLALAEPSDFRRARSSFTIGLSAGSFVGSELGDATLSGLGLNVSESVRWGTFGLGARLGAAVILTESAELPFDEGLQTYYLALGPRFTFPTFDALALHLFVQPEFVFGGFQSNSLVRLTDNEQQYLGTGAWLGVELLSGGLVFELALGTTWLWSYDSALMLLTLSTGFSGVL